MRSSFARVVLLVVACSSARAQSLIRNHALTDPTGVAVAGLSDVDGDSVADYAIAGDGASGLGEISVFSGASGVLLRSLAGDATTGPIGDRLADAGDVDGDGALDLAVGGDHGAAVFSIATGARLYWFAAPTAGQPVAVAGLGDVDVDGFDDVLLGVAAIQVTPAPPPNMGWSVNALGTSYAEIRSGQTGSIVRTHFAGATTSSYGATVCALGDADGDGVGDYAISTRMDPTPALTNVVDVFSGASGALLRSFPLGAAPAWTVDGAIADMGDLDGDGATDLALGEPRRGVVRCVSIATGATLSTIRPAQTPLLELSFAQHLAALPDVDLDGKRDLAVAVLSPPCPPGTQPCDIIPHRVEIYSGASGANLLGWPGDGDGTIVGSLSGVGDVDGDGRGELLLGLDNAFTPPSTYYGKASLRSMLSDFTAPENFCRAYDVQVTGQTTSITWSGSTSVAAADFDLLAFDAPSARPGYFLATHRFGPWTSGATVLCIRPPGLRLGPSMLTSATGQATYDLFAGPSSSAFVAGTTWYFQFVYESDYLSPGVYFTSDALGVTFAP